jgi:hypothetical protein
MRSLLASRNLVVLWLAGDHEFIMDIDEILTDFD